MVAEVDTVVTMIMTLFLIGRPSLYIDILNHLLLTLGGINSFAGQEDRKEVWRCFLIAMLQEQLTQYHDFQDSSHCNQIYINPDLTLHN